MFADLYQLIFRGAVDVMLQCLREFASSLAADQVGSVLSLIEVGVQSSMNGEVGISANRTCEVSVVLGRQCEVADQGWLYAARVIVLSRAK